MEESGWFAPSLTARVLNVVMGRETVLIVLCVADVSIGVVIGRGELNGSNLVPRQIFRVCIRSGVIDMFPLHHPLVAIFRPLTGGIVMMG